MMKVLIIEDEQLSARRLEKMILEYDNNISILAILDSIESSIAWFQMNKEPDLIFLDIQLSDGESFSIFKEVELNAPVIFTTAYNEYAIKAFSLNSIDYLLKPVNKADLIKALKKYSRLNAPHQYDYNELIKVKDSGSKNYQTRMMVKLGSTIKSLQVDQIAYFYIQDRITFATLKDGSRFPIDQSLEKLEKELDPGKFFRVNRQFMINFSSIERMVAYSKSRIKIVLDPTTPVEVISSSEKTAFFKQWLDGH